MWVFTEVADWFDQQRVANNKFLDETFQDWVDYAVQHDSDAGYWPAVRNAMIYTGAGTLYAANQLTTTVASGFVDTLRIGDGVRKGGWGYAQDALRLLSVAGAAARPLNGALKLGRIGLAQVLAVDLAPAEPICTWITAAKALVMTGTRHFATVEMVETAVGWPGASQVPTAVFLDTLLGGMQGLGASARDAGPLSGPVEEALLGLLKANPDSVAPFSVKWVWTGETTANVANEFVGTVKGQAVGHTMLAYRSPLTGALEILDRTGKIFESLAELEATYPDNYAGITQAAFYEYEGVTTALLVDQATVVPFLQNGAALATLTQAGATPLRGPDGTLVTDASWLRQAIGLEIRSVPFRVETKRSIPVPVRVALAKGDIKTQTVCVPIINNSDAPPSAPTQDCSTLRVYVVQPGDTLSAVARSAYGNAQRWQGIAVVNQIKNPDALQPGMTLLIP